MLGFLSQTMSPQRANVEGVLAAAGAPRTATAVAAATPTPCSSLLSVASSCLASPPRAQRMAGKGSVEVSLALEPRAAPDGAPSVPGRTINITLPTDGARVVIGRDAARAAASSSSQSYHSYVEIAFPLLSVDHLAIWAAHVADEPFVPADHDNSTVTAGAPTVPVSAGGGAVAVFVRDLGSSNGSMLNRTRLRVAAAGGDGGSGGADGQRLFAGDTLRLADADAGGGLVLRVESMSPPLAVATRKRYAAALAEAAAARARRPRRAQVSSTSSSAAVVVAACHAGAAGGGAKKRRAPAVTASAAASGATANALADSDSDPGEAVTGLMALSTSKGFLALAARHTKKAKNSRVERNVAATSATTTAAAAGTETSATTSPPIAAWQAAVRSTLRPGDLVWVRSCVAVCVGGNGETLFAPVIFFRFPALLDVLFCVVSFNSFDCCCCRRRRRRRRTGVSA
jgi:hypothetical protein